MMQTVVKLWNRKMINFKNTLQSFLLGSIWGLFSVVPVGGTENFHREDFIGGEQKFFTCVGLLWS